MKRIAVIGLASTLLLAPVTTKASDFCMGIGSLAYKAAVARDVGVTYRQAVRAFNHGYDTYLGGFYAETRLQRMQRRFSDWVIKGVYQVPFMAPEDEQARVVGKCEILSQHDTDDPEPEPGVDNE